MTKVRTLDDSTLLIMSDLVAAVKQTTVVASARAEIQAEIQRRAEIRLVRAEGGAHDAAWYESRPLTLGSQLGMEDRPIGHEAHADDPDPDCDDCQSAHDRMWNRA